MSKFLPLLIFPKAKAIEPSKRKQGFGKPDVHFPDHQRQIERLTPKIEKLKASVSNTITDLEPETALVIEIVDSVENFRQAVEKVGLEWMGEWDIDDIEPDEDFYVLTEDKKDMKKLKRQLFVSFFDQKGKEKLLSLWEQWKENEQFARGEKKWKHVFTKAYDIRQWGIKETLRETGMIDRWKALIDPVNEEESITFQIDLFYRKNEEKRKKNERDIENLLKDIGGKKLGPFIDMPYIAFHAVKAELPAKKIKDLLQKIEPQQQSELDIQLFTFPGIMYFRPTGQSIAVSEQDQDITDKEAKFSEGRAELPPIAAIS